MSKLRNIRRHEKWNESNFISETRKRKHHEWSRKFPLCYMPSARVKQVIIQNQSSLLWNMINKPPRSQHIETLILLLAGAYIHARAHRHRFVLFRPRAAAAILYNQRAYHFRAWVTFSRSRKQPSPYKIIVISARILLCSRPHIYVYVCIIYIPVRLISVLSCINHLLLSRLLLFYIFMMIAFMASFLFLCPFISWFNFFPAAFTTLSLSLSLSLIFSFFQSLCSTSILRTHAHSCVRRQGEGVRHLLLYAAVLRLILCVRIAASLIFDTTRTRAERLVSVCTFWRLVYIHAITLTGILIINKKCCLVECRGAINIREVSARILFKDINMCIFI